ncbi:MAG: MBL fold metallo-hydrolase, partial [Bdellovibrionales bacterium]
TGDTRIEFSDSTQVQNSRVLLMEVTSWDDRKGVEQARSWGHTHFHEFLTRLDQLNCEKIVLIHTSARYSTRALQELIDEYVPEPHRARVELFPRPS